MLILFLFGRTFNAMLMIEPDVRLVRNFWIDMWVRRMLGAPGFWILGSAFRGQRILGQEGLKEIEE